MMRKVCVQPRSAALGVVLCAAAARTRLDRHGHAAATRSGSLETGNEVNQITVSYDAGIGPLHGRGLGGEPDAERDLHHGRRAHARPARAPGSRRISRIATTDAQDDSIPMDLDLRWPGNDTSPGRTPARSRRTGQRLCERPRDRSTAASGNDLILGSALADNVRGEQRPGHARRRATAPMTSRAAAAPTRCSIRRAAHAGQRHHRQRKRQRRRARGSGGQAGATPSTATSRSSSAPSRTTLIAGDRAPRR